MLRYLFCVLLAPVAVVAVATQASARNTDNSLQATVSVRGVDFADPAQARAAYARMETVAHQVCDTANRELSAVAESADCRERALDEAVRRLDRPTLNAVRQADLAAKASAKNLSPRR